MPKIVLSLAQFTETINLASGYNTKGSQWHKQIKLQAQNHHGRQEHNDADY